MKALSKLKTASLCLLIIGAAALGACSTGDVNNTAGSAAGGGESSGAQDSFAASTYTSAPERVKAIFALDAVPDKVWAFVGDHQSIPALSGGSVHTVSLNDSNAKQDGGEGCVRSCELKMPGPDGTPMDVLIKEDIVFYDDTSHTYAYSLQTPNPMALENHLGVFRVAADKKGSKVEWISYFDHAAPEQMTVRFQMFAGMIEDALIEKFGGKRLDKGREVLIAATKPEPTNFTKSPLVYEATFELNTSADEAWIFLGDHQSLPTLTGGVVHTVALDNSNANAPGEAGSIRSCDIVIPGPDGQPIAMQLQEDIRFYSDLHRTYGYSVKSPNPFGVKDHLGVFTISELEGKTLVIWQTYGTHQSAKVFTQQVSDFAGMIEAGLIKKFGGKRLS